MFLVKGPEVFRVLLRDLNHWEVAPFRPEGSVPLLLPRVFLLEEEDPRKKKWDRAFRTERRNFPVIEITKEDPEDLRAFYQEQRGRRLGNVLVMLEVLDSKVTLRGSPIWEGSLDEEGKIIPTRKVDPRGSPTWEDPSDEEGLLDGEGLLAEGGLEGDENGSRGLHFLGSEDRDRDVGSPPSPPSRGEERPGLPGVSGEEPELPGLPGVSGGEPELPGVLDRGSGLRGSRIRWGLREPPLEWGLRRLEALVGELEESWNEGLDDLGRDLRSFEARRVAHRYRLLAKGRSIVKETTRRESERALSRHSRVPDGR